MKKKYEAPVINVTVFEEEDEFLTTSSTIETFDEVMRNELPLA